MQSNLSSPFVILHSTIVRGCFGENKHLFRKEESYLILYFRPRAYLPQKTGKETPSQKGERDSGVISEVSDIIRLGCISFFVFFISDP